MENPKKQGAFEKLKLISFVRTLVPVLVNKVDSNLLT